MVNVSESICTAFVFIDDCTVCCRPGKTLHPTAMDIHVFSQALLEKSLLGRISEMLIDIERGRGLERGGDILRENR